MSRNVKKFQGHESFQRLNFLYQISKYASEKNPILSSYYGNLIVNVAKKNVLKIHPEVKRQFCKKCKCVLVHNVSAKMKIKKEKQVKVVQWTCNTCGTKRELPINKGLDKTLWVERPEAVVCVINN